MNKIKTYFHDKKAVISDLLFIVGAACTMTFVGFSQFFELQPTKLPLAAGWIFTIFFFGFICFVITFFIERSRKNLPNPIITIVFFLLFVAGFVSIFIEPRDFSISGINIKGSLPEASFRISGSHMMFYAFTRALITMMIYIGLLVFPKRYKSKKVVNWVCYTILAVCLASLIYSYIVEWGKYWPTIQGLFDDKTSTPDDFLESFVMNRNGFGMLLLLGLCATFVLHGITRKWWFIIISIFLYLSIVLTCCKSSIVLGLFALLFYYYYVLFSMLKKHRIRNTVFLILLTLIVGSVAYLMWLSWVTDGEFLSFLNSTIEIYTSSSTLESRYHIWEVGYLLLNQNLPLNLSLGRGFGFSNEMIAMIFGNGLFSYHNSYVALLLSGGIPYLAGYALLLIYAFVICFRYMKRNHKVNVPILLGLFIFTAYSMVETIHYFVYIFMFMIFIYYQITKKEVKMENER